MKKLLSALLCVICISAAAKVKLPALVGSNMVLQRSASVNLWGWADAGKMVTVTVSWDEKTQYRTKATQDGSWILKVVTPHSGGPYMITVSDGTPLTISNVMIGEVWICSGQSNMEMSLGGYTGQPVDNSLKTIAGAGVYRDRIRMFSVQHKSTAEKQDDCPGASWEVSSPAAAESCSATAYFFARNIADVLDVPVGIIMTNWGGSRIEAWMDESSAAATPGLDLQAARERKGENHGLSLLFNGMLWPVRNYTARGFTWYQGESNRSDYSAYAGSMASMVGLWRSLWGDAQNLMPFYYVQIAPFNYGDSGDMLSGYLVEAQCKALALIPNTGMAGTSDIGDEFCIHPAQKEEVGFRLALLALVKTYGQSGLPSVGPVYKNVKFNKETAVVQFENLPRGLDPGREGVQGFELAGADRVFYPAEARVMPAKCQVALTSERVPEPVAVRYAFRNYAAAGLKDTFGLPAFPFRTDDWSYTPAR